jgi:protein-disulfide isomerase
VSSRKEQKEQARIAREAKEQELAQAAAKKRRLSIIGGVIGLAAIAALVAVLVSAGGGKSNDADAAEVNARYAGIPQKGVVLGEPAAKATIVEFADLRCPYCKEFEDGSMATIVDELIKTGKAKYIFRSLTMLDGQSPSGDNSTLAARYVNAAGLQNKMYPMINLLYMNQGPESQDWVTDKLLLDLGGQVTGLNAQEAMDNRENPKVTALLAKAEDQANELGVRGTPTIYVGKDENSLKRVSTNDLSDPSAIIDAVDALQ